MIRTVCAVLPAIIAICPTTAEADVDFERDVAPLLVRRCLECHNQREASGGLVLVDRERAMKGGDSGPAIQPGQPESSLLVHRIEAGEMPPEKQGRPQPLPEQEVETLIQWIAHGAVWPDGRVLDIYERTTDVRGGRDWWSFQPVERPEVPNVRQKDRVANPIDAFVLSRLEEQGMAPAPLADRRTLVRRAFIDVIGLPPSFEQMEAFANDASANAWERLVDSLLESPHYGERWARYWLDLVRFAETSGYERDQEKPFAWRYRDWVVDALNRDIPYDEFIVHQLAGDEIDGRDEQSVIATGFLRLGTWNDEPNDDGEYRYERLEDMVHATSSAFLGLTVKCARCHDHKFDPILQEDYYRMASAFWAGPIIGRDRKLLGGPSADELGFENVLGWTDLGPAPAPLHLLRNGDPDHPKQVIEYGHLSTIRTLARPIEPPPSGSTTSQRRRQLAEWIADPANPLTPRVFVNRLWQHHFGEGLVRSPNNFGFRSDPPTHRRLLDWLATELVDGGWNVKRLHKLILMSFTWRQSSVHPQFEAYQESDSANRLWWRANRRRLDADALRDAMLTASGQIDLKPGGPSFKPTISPAALEGLSRKSSAWQASPSEQQLRRSLYIYSKRGLLPPMMTTFDQPDTTLPCGQRDVTTVAPQALALLNNRFTHEQSLALARRVHTVAGKNLDEQIRHAWKFSLGRTATDDELQLGRGHFHRQHARFLSPTDDRTTSDRLLPNIIELDVRDGLSLHLKADVGIHADTDGRVEAWDDQSPGKHHARQSEAGRRPSFVPEAINGLPTVRFDGQRRFLRLAGELLPSDKCSIFAVVTDTAQQPGLREIISNWNGGNGNSTTSIFLGLRDTDVVRFSDGFAQAGRISKRHEPFLITAVNAGTEAKVWQSTTEIASLGGPLTGRKLGFEWVVGQQGNIDGEYWTGDIAELLVYGRALTEKERVRVWSYLLKRYDIPSAVDQPQPVRETPALLALASLCHVLLNSNEFIYID